MSETVIWRKAYPSDQRMLALVHHAAWHDTYSDLYPREFLDDRPFEFFHGLWDAFLQDARRPTILALVNREVKGFLRYSADGEVCTLYVHPESRRKGIGTTLLEEAEFDMRRIGNKDFRTFVVEGNAKARVFFAGEGYEQTRTAMQEFDGTSLPMIEMTKPAATSH